jgi:hypothetical protein
MPIEKIVILVDYRMQFYSSIKISTGGMDLECIKKNFLVHNIVCEIIPYSEFCLDYSWDGCYVLYQSSEDRGLIYKSYISDILMSIKVAGGILLPEFDYFFAHENKSFQAFLSKGISTEILNVPNSQVYGTFEDLNKNIDKILFPQVLKLANGCQSKGVTLVNNKDECLKKAKKFTSTFNFSDFLRFKYKTYFKKGYIKESLNKNKIVLQEFIPNLEGDYKVLVYGNKAFVLTRKSKKNDFRASGSGLFDFDIDVPQAVLDSALFLKEFFNCPFISIDIAYDKINKQCHLIEFQFLMFGTYTVEKSPHYFEHQANSWILREGESNLEDVFVTSLVEYLRK